MPGTSCCALGRQLCINCTGPPAVPAKLRLCILVVVAMLQACKVRHHALAHVDSSFFPESVVIQHTQVSLCCAVGILTVSSCTILDFGDHLVFPLNWMFASG